MYKLTKTLTVVILHLRKSYTSDISVSIEVIWINPQRSCYIFSKLQPIFHILHTFVEEYVKNTSLVKVYLHLVLFELQWIRELYRDPRCSWFINRWLHTIRAEQNVSCVSVGVQFSSFRSLVAHVISIFNLLWFVKFYLITFK